MSSLIFVHGTGVRKEGYDLSLGYIRDNLNQNKPKLDVRESRWYKKCGVTLHFDGASIPTYATARAEEAVLPADEGVAIWSLLYDDPLYELRMLAVRGGAKELPPGQLPPWTNLSNTINSLTADDTLKQLLDRARLTSYWADALTYVRKSGITTAAIKTMGAAASEYRGAVARAIMAKATLLAAEEGGPPPSGDLRDKLVEHIITLLGGEERFVGKWFKDQLKGVAWSMATAYAKRKRGVFSNAAYPVAGDILLYQVRGDDIRKYIRDCINEASDPVTLLGHSLGGVASVDLLASEQIPKVKLLITVGSQAPLFYEIDALWSRRPPSGLPGLFPRWLNIFDKRDLLSYIGEGVFGKEKITDKEVDNGQPFPESHSAYWTNPVVWKEILDALP